MPAGDDHLPAPGSAFAVTRRGYDPAQVDDYLRHLDAQLRMLAADRDAAIEQNGQLTRQVNVAWAETDRLKGQLRRLSAPPESVEGMSERLQSMLRLAEDEAAERRKRAEAEAAEIIERAESEAAALPARNEATRLQLEHERGQLTVERERVMAMARAEADRVRAAADAAASRLRAEVTAEVHHMRREADRERQALDAEGMAKRTQVEEDFAIAMAARRVEAMAAIGESETRRRTEAETVLANARAEAERRIVEADHAAHATVADAQRGVDELTTMRDRMVTRLSELRGLLDQAIPRLTEPERAPRPAAESGRDNGHPGPAAPSSAAAPEEAAITGHAAHNGAGADASGAVQPTPGEAVPGDATSGEAPAPRPSPERRPTPRPRATPAGRWR